MFLGRFASGEFGSDGGACSGGGVLGICSLAQNIGRYEMCECACTVVRRAEGC